MKRNLFSTAFMALTVAVAACSDPGTRGTSARMPNQAAAMQADASLPVAPGIPADWDKFPATCGFRADVPCTCVLVGPQTLLTAAHCPLPTNPEKTIGKGRIRVFGHSGQRNVNCEIRADLDLALCTTSPVDNIPFETLNTVQLTANGQLLLTGFGSNGTPASAGPLRKGFTNITSLPGAGSHLIRIGGGARLLEGDSGGPAYLLFSPGNENGPRVVAGINENLFDVTSVSTPGSLSFIKFRKNGTPREAQICGINTPAGTQGCRSLS